MIFRKKHYYFVRASITHEVDDETTTGAANMVVQMDRRITSGAAVEKISKAIVEAGVTTAGGEHIDALDAQVISISRL